MTAYRTIDGDTADLIAYRTLGRTAGATEALLALNPGLAAAGPILPAGIVVELPRLAEPEPAPRVVLWE